MRLFWPAKMGFEVLEDRRLLHGSDASSATSIEVGTAITGELEPDEEDWFVLSAEPDVSYSFSSPIETSLALLNSNNERLFVEEFSKTLSVPESSEIFFRFTYESASSYEFEISTYEDDHANIIEQGTLVEEDVFASGSINIPGDRDVFAFPATAGFDYLVEVTSTGATPRLAVLSGDGFRLASDDVANGFLTVRVAERQTWYVVIDSPRGSSDPTVDYQLLIRNLSAVPDVSDTIDSAERIQIGKIVDSRLETSSDVDWFVFAGLAGQAYEVSAIANSFDFQLYDGEGRRLGTQSPSLPFSIRFPSDQEVHMAFRGGPQNFAFDVQEVIEGGASQQNAIGVQIDKPTAVRFDTSLDEQWFSFMATAGIPYRVDFIDAETGNASAGVQVFDEAGETLLAELVETKTNTRIFVRMQADVMGGSHRLVVSELLDDHADTLEEATDLSVVESFKLSPGDEDWFRFVPIQGSFYVFETPPFEGDSDQPQAETTLRDTEGKSVGRQVGRRIAWKAISAEPVFLRSAASGDATEVLSYQILVADDDGEALLDATAMELNDRRLTAFGEIQFEDDGDTFSFEIEEDTDLVVAISDRDGLPLAGLDLEVRNEVADLVEPSLDQSATQRFSLGRGKYFVTVWGEVSNEGYRVQVNLIPGEDDHGETRADATPLSIGSWRAGVINSPLDVDAFTFSALPGKAYYVDAFGAADVKVYNTTGDLLQTGSGQTIVHYDGDESETLLLEVSNYGFDEDYTVLVTIVNDDHGDSRATATEIFVGLTQPGRKDVRGDTDFFRFDAEAGKSYLILPQLEQEPYALTLFGTDIELRNSTSPFVWTAVETETLYVSFATSNNDGPVDYEMLVEDFSTIDDHGGGPGDATAIEIGELVDGMISVLGDVDWFKVDVEQGRRYLVSSEIGSVEAWIADEAGNPAHLLAPADRELVFTAEQTGSVYLSIEDSTANSYQIQVLPFVDDHGDLLETASMVEVGSETAGELFPTGDVDLFRFEAQRDQNYRLEVQLEDLAVSELRLADSTGVVLADDGDDKIAGSIVSWRAPESGTYFLQVSGLQGSDASTGTYRLIVAKEDRRAESMVAIDRLCEQISSGQFNPDSDYLADGIINHADLEMFVTESAESFLGDADLNGEVNFADFLVLSSNFGQADVGWAGGDFDCSGDVTFADFLVLSTNFGNSFSSDANQR